MLEILLRKISFELVNNSILGKTMENIRKSINVKLLTDEKRLVELAAKPTFVSSNI